MNRTRLALLYLCCLSVTAAYGAPVDRNSAMRSASDFFERQGYPQLSASLENNERLSRGNENNEDRPYHVFNIGENNGFIVIAGDDRAQTVLAYSYEGHFDTDNLPDACKKWMQNYVIEIESLKNDIPFSSEKRSAELTYPTEAIAPLLKTKWGQGHPYNAKCPKDTKNYNYPCLTGCVATAVAQIMNYYRYPQRGTGSIKYMDNNQEVERALDFSSCSDFAWDDMLETFPLNVTSSQQRAISDLMMQVGYSCKMQYSSVSSTSHNRDAGIALVNNFGYDNNIKHYERNYMTEEEWVDVLTSELMSSRPVLYYGYQNNTDAHTFICDGYDGQGSFHFNWGGNGNNDGYYRLSALTPGSYDYTKGQMIECGIMPLGSAGSVTQTDNLLGYQILYYCNSQGYYNCNEYESATGRTGNSGFFFYCWNLGYKPFEGEVCMATMIDGTLTPIASLPTEIQPNTRIGQKLIIPYGKLDDGTYTVSFHYRFNDNDDWHRIGAYTGNPAEGTITIKGSDIQFGDNGSSAIDPTITDTAVEITYQAGILTVNSSVPVKAIRMTDLSGRCQRELSNCDTETTIRTDGLSKGIYIVEIRTADSKSVIKKIAL